MSGDDDRVLTENRGAQLEWVLPLKGRVPVAISYSTTPRAQMSLEIVHVLAAQLLGRHVRQCADGRPGLRERAHASG